MFEQLHRGKTLDLKQCFDMEFNVSQAFMSGTEFFEGVRALLVDKDKSPRWSPASLDQVTRDMVESHFQPAQPPIY